MDRGCEFTEWVCVCVCVWRRAGKRVYKRAQDLRILILAEEKMKQSESQTDLTVYLSPSYGFLQSTDDSL